MIYNIHYLWLVARRGLANNSHLLRFINNMALFLCFIPGSGELTATSSLIPHSLHTELYYLGGY